MPRAVAPAPVDPYLTIPHVKHMKPSSAAVMLRMAAAGEEALLAQYPDPNGWGDKAAVERRVQAMKDEATRLETLAKAPVTEIRA